MEKRIRTGFPPGAAPGADSALIDTEETRWESAPAVSSGQINRGITRWASRFGDSYRDRRSNGALGAALLSFALLYVIFKGTFAAGAKDIDTRYFFIAGKIWIQGHSPYEFARYSDLWKRYFSDEISPGGFAYFPGAFLYSAPLGVTEWPAAALIFRVFNVAAAVLIVGLCLSYMRKNGDTPLGIVRYAWIAFGILIGGVPGTILTGQSTVIVCAAALTVSVLPLRFWPLFVPAVIVASSKPQIAGPIFAVLLLGYRPGRRYILGAGLAALIVCLWVMSRDSAPATHLLQAVRGNASLGANGPTRMIGLEPLLETLSVDPRIARALGWLLLVAVIAMVGGRSGRSNSSQRQLIPTVIMAGFVSIGLAYPFHVYDTAMFAPVCGLAGLLSMRRQLFLLPVFAVMGRPRLVSWVWEKAGEISARDNTMCGVLWLSAVVAIVYWAVNDSRQGVAARD